MDNKVADRNPVYEPAMDSNRKAIKQEMESLARGPKALTPEQSSQVAKAYERQESVRVGGQDVEDLLNDKYIKEVIKRSNIMGGHNGMTARQMVAADNSIKVHYTKADGNTLKRIEQAVSDDLYSNPLTSVGDQVKSSALKKIRGVRSSHSELTQGDDMYSMLMGMGPNQYRVLSALRDKAVPAIDDIIEDSWTSGLNANGYAGAVRRNINKIIERETGLKNVDLDRILSPEQLERLDRVTNSISHSRTTNGSVQFRISCSEVK